MECKEQGRSCGTEAVAIDQEEGAFSYLFEGTGHVRSPRNQQKDMPSLRVRSRVRRGCFYSAASSDNSRLEAAVNSQMGGDRPGRRGSACVPEVIA